MPRPPNMLKPEHPAIVSGEPVWSDKYAAGCSQPCSLLRCPGCGKERLYPWSTLRQMIKRPHFHGACHKCMAEKRDYKRVSRGSGSRVGSGGYVELRLKAIDPEDEHLFHALRGTSRFVLEHRWVMAKSLGRALTDDENVHHKNGKRDDNRLENLELWLTPQPCGQRVEDVVKWAREIEHRYGFLVPQVS